jgi:hypothetical protein
MITFDEGGIYVGEITINKHSPILFRINNIKYENNINYKSAVRSYGPTKERHHLEIKCDENTLQFIDSAMNRVLDLYIYKLSNDDVTCDFFISCDLDNITNDKLRLTSYNRLSDIISIELFRKRDDIKTMFDVIKRDLKLEKLINQLL